jgi:hypothetical protein
MPSGEFDHGVVKRPRFSVHGLNPAHFDRTRLSRLEHPKEASIRKLRNPVEIRTLVHRRRSVRAPLFRITTLITT